MKRGTTSTDNGVWVALDEAVYSGAVRGVELDGAWLPFSTQARTAINSLTGYLGPKDVQDVQVFLQPSGTGNTAGISRVKAEQGSAALQKMQKLLPVAGQEYDEAQSRTLLGVMRGVVQQLKNAAGWTR